jgi:hypothetical protein
MASGSAPNIDGMLLLEGPFARVPHDELRRQLRSQQRMIERDMTFCSTTLSSLASSALAASGSNNNNVGGVEEVVQPLSAVGDTSFPADTSFMSEGTRADESVITLFEGDDEGDAENTSIGGRARNADLEKSLDVMLGRLKGLKRKVSSV